MNIDKKLVFDFTDYAGTKKLAKVIADSLEPGDVIELISDLGGGKTALVREIVAAMGSQDRVDSPTFTVENIYHTKGPEVHHYDFYRLDQPGIMLDQIQEVLEAHNTVVFIEWGDIIKSQLPDTRAVISIEATGEESRRFEVLFGDPSHRLVEALENLC